MTDTTDTRATAEQIIEELQLQPHPEGGYYRELHVSRQKIHANQRDRAALSAIYHLLAECQHSRWHTFDADEVWSFLDGGLLELLVYDPRTAQLTRTVLGHPTEATPLAIAPAGTWQAARPLRDHALVSCSVGPAFEFSTFRFVADLEDHERVFEDQLREYRSLL